MVKKFMFDEVPVIQTKAGKLKGYFYNGVHIFKGIPYAQAKRFQMPEEVTPWEGIKDATSYGYVCPLMAQDNPSSELMVPHRYWPQDENCQNLNIWTKTLDENAKKPVLVWLHGGGFTAGSSIEQVAYDGGNMSQYGDVVVVSVNHRLNILGYMDLSPFGEKYKNSANAGHADLVAALKWVKENIAQFGGNPENVTLFGQSGGGMKVTGLMQIPDADGLFHKGIVMSGIDDGKFMPQAKGDGKIIVTAMLEELGLTENDVEALETLPYSELVKVYGKVCPEVMQQGGYMGCAPLKNDYYFGEPLIHGFTEHAKTIPLMIGSVFGEFTFKLNNFNKYELSNEQEKEMITERFGEHTQEFMDLFAKAYPEKKVIDLLSLDRIFRIPSKELAKLLAEGGKAPAFLYNFTLEFPIANGKVAWHCSDIPFVFRNTDKVEICNIAGVSDELEEKIFQAVISFANSGNPNHQGIPKWPEVKPEDEPTMIFDRECKILHNYDDKLMKLFDDIYGPINLTELFGQDIQH